ncbi:unnamed protein product [Amoebophrya sp. A120]|nr:unnamed protein product [Amoebophrya sp. A120]|eukprot:GSA120T00006581001.1
MSGTPAPAPVPNTPAPAPPAPAPLVGSSDKDASDDGTEPGVVVAIVFAVIIVMMGIGFAFYHFRQSERDVWAPDGVQPWVVVDEDGGTWKEPKRRRSRSSRASRSRDADGTEMVESFGWSEEHSVGWPNADELPPPPAAPRSPRMKKGKGKNAARPW